MKMLRSLFFPLILVLATCSQTPVAPDNNAEIEAASTEIEAASAEIEGTSIPTATSQAEANESDTVAASEQYIVQPGDVLTISVWKEENLQREVVVRPDGMLNFPLIGDLDVNGKTIEQVKIDLADKLTRFVPDPVVSVAMRSSQGYKIYVVGKVTRPGELVSNRNIDVMQALSMAGGLTPFASANKIKILRREKGVLIAIPFRYSDVRKGKKLEQNIVLRGGDVVVVP